MTLRRSALARVTKRPSSERRSSLVARSPRRPPPHPGPQSEARRHAAVLDRRRRARVPEQQRIRRQRAPGRRRGRSVPRRRSGAARNARVRRQIEHQTRPGRGRVRRSSGKHDRVREYDGCVREADVRGSVVGGVAARGCGFLERGVRRVRQGRESVAENSTARQRFGRSARARVERSARGGRGVAVRAGGEASVGDHVLGDDFSARRQLGRSGEFSGVRIVDDVQTTGVRGGSEQWDGDCARDGRSRGDTAEHASLPHRVDVLLFRRGSRFGGCGSDIGGGNHRRFVRGGGGQHARGGVRDIQVRRRRAWRVREGVRARELADGQGVDRVAQGSGGGIRGESSGEQGSHALRGVQ